MLRRPARAEGFQLLATGASVDPGTLLAEPGHEGGPGKVGHGSDPAQPEPGQPGADIRIRGEEAGRMRREELGLAARRDEERRPGPGQDGRHGRAEPGAGDPGPDLARGRVRGRGRAALSGLAQDAAERLDQPRDQDRLRSPQRLEAVDLDLEQPERGVEPDRRCRRSRG